MTTEKKSHVDRAVAFIKERGRMRSPDLAKALGVPAKDLMAILGYAVSRGVLSTCKVIGDNNREVNEWDIGPGKPPVSTQGDYKPPKPTIVPVRPQGGAAPAAPATPIALPQTGNDKESRFAWSRNSATENAGTGAPAAESVSSSTPSAVAENPPTEPVLQPTDPVGGATSEPRRAKPHMPYFAVDTEGRLVLDFHQLDAPLVLPPAQHLMLRKFLEMNAGGFLK